MSNTLLVMKFAIKNQLRMISTAIITLTIIFICVAGTIVILAALILNPEMEKAVPDMSVLENAIGLTLFCASFISIGIYASVFSYQSLVREKAGGNIQALLATPISTKEMWLGKSLAVFLPGLIFNFIMTVAAFLVLNIIYFAGDTGFVFTPWMFVSNLLAVPLLYLAVTMFVHIIGLVGKPVTANVIGQIFLPVMANVMIQLAVRSSLGASSWLFAIILLGTTAVTVIGISLLVRNLTAEKIMFSL
ncbi:MAG: ABC transporter permease subunit [Dehalococcoidales bacterium]|nr:ABC transporter permease subunit [Dehalococcoidales bacterium]